MSVKRIFVQVGTISLIRKVYVGDAVYMRFDFGSTSVPVFDLNADDYSSLIAAIKAMTIACGEDDVDGVERLRDRDA